MSKRRGGAPAPPPRRRDPPIHPRLRIDPGILPSSVFPINLNMYLFFYTSISTCLPTCLPTYPSFQLPISSARTRRPAPQADPAGGATITAPGRPARAAVTPALLRSGPAARWASRCPTSLLARDANRRQAPAPPLGSVRQQSLGLSPWRLAVA